MKYLYVLLILLLNCTPSSRKEEGAAADTIATAAMPVATEATSAEIAETETPAFPVIEVVYDSVYSNERIDLSRLAQYPLGHTAYDSITKYLKDSDIAFTTALVNDVPQISFDRSVINILIAEAYGDLICSAEIFCPAYQLPEGVKIGMPLDNFLSRASLIRDSLQGYDDDLYYERNEGGTHVGGTSTLKIIFKENRLLGIEYGFDPCMIYD